VKLLGLSIEAGFDGARQMKHDRPLQHAALSAPDAAITGTGALVQRFRGTPESSLKVLLTGGYLHHSGPSMGYHDWKRDEECELEDASSCPQSHPQQLTAEERDVVKDMVTSEQYRHVSTGTLAVFAQRLDKVFASPSTWHRLVRKNGWRRPRKRVHPAKPKLGVRASGSNEIWHVDTSAVRLLDGTRAYLYAVIDNFSRRILAWRVSENFDPTNTLAILLEAASGVDRSGDPPTLLADSGVENRTKAIDELVESGVLRRALLPPR
jgi:putative transposase